MLLLTVTTAVLVVVSILVFGRLRKAARADGADGLASRDGTRRYLAENWHLVERSARDSGMSDEEIARVRANLLG
jgi:hypothetical protein